MNPAKELSTHELFGQWTNRENLFSPEEYLLTKYLKDTTKRVVEAGTGGGRIIFFVERMGFSDLEAFDLVPQFIDHARSLAAEKQSRVRFSVADAANLDIYQEQSFDYLIYLQQVLCFLPEDQFLAGLQEVYRVAKDNGIVILSFLDWDARKFNSLLSILVNLSRRLRRQRISKQYLPLLRLSSQPNLGLLSRNQIAARWVKKGDILATLRDVGFSIVEAASKEIDPENDILYIVCTKPVRKQKRASGTSMV